MRRQGSAKLVPASMVLSNAVATMYLVSWSERKKHQKLDIRQCEKQSLHFVLVKRNNSQGTENTNFSFAAERKIKFLKVVCFGSLYLCYLFRWKVARHNSSQYSRNTFTSFRFSMCSCCGTYGWKVLFMKNHKHAHSPSIVSIAVRSVFINLKLSDRTYFVFYGEWFRRSSSSRHVGCAKSNWFSLIQNCK